MKWLTLQLTSLPLIALQTDKAIKIYQELKEKVNKFAKPQDIVEFNEFRQQIQRRIIMLDSFYKKHINDQSISLFHMLKLKLMRTLFKSKSIDDGSIEISLINSREDTQNFHHTEKSSLLDDQLFGRYGKNQPLFQQQVAANIPLQTQIQGRKQKRQIIPSSQIEQSIWKQSKIKKLDKNSYSQVSPIKQTQGSYKNLKTSKISPSKLNKKNAILTSRTQIMKTQPSIQRISPSKQYIANFKKYTKQPIKGTNSTFQANTKKQVNNKKQSKQIKVQQNDKKQQQGNQFRFTIKMTKQQYKKLLQMKKQMVKTKK